MFTSSSSQPRRLLRDADSDGARTAWPWYAQLVAAAVVLLVLFGMQTGPQRPSGEESAPSRPGHAAMENAAPASPLTDGEEIYNTRCMSCHQMNGQGVPGTFPPLTDTEWVNGDKGRLIRLLLHGLTGTIEVAGKKYSGIMPPWGGALNDEEIAQIATYVRTNFGNDAPPITTEEVAKVRAATKGRTKPWTAEELKQEANQGIPGDSTASG